MSDFFSKILAVFPKEVRDNWVIIILLLIGGLYLYNYFRMKGSYGGEMMSGNDQRAYKKQNGAPSVSGPQPAEDIDANGALTGAWESGLGTWSTGNVLARTTIYASSNLNSAVPWLAGTRRIALAITADTFNASTSDFAT